MTRLLICIHRSIFSEFCHGIYFVHLKWLPRLIFGLAFILARKQRGEYAYHSFLEFIDDKYEPFKQVHSIEVARRYNNSKKFEKVDILNLHSGIDLLEDLFCNFIPEAFATCHTIKQNRTNFAKSNQGQDHEFERLATLALHAEKIQDYHSAIARRKAKKLRSLVSDNNLVPPEKCLNQTFLSELFEAEKEFEESYFKDWYASQGGDSGLKEDFQRSTAQKKFCSMDTDLILSSGMFDHIFKELG